VALGTQACLAVANKQLPRKASTAAPTRPQRGGAVIDNPPTSISKENEYKYKMDGAAASSDVQRKVASHGLLQQSPMM
jgi:hypothetical protein